MRDAPYSHKMQLNYDYPSGWSLLCMFPPIFGKPLTGMIASVLECYTVGLSEGAGRVCTVSWKAFPAVNEGTALAGIGTVSPVRGLRPSRAWR